MSPRTQEINRMIEINARELELDEKKTVVPPKLQAAELETNIEDETTDIDPPPDGGFGWVQVGAVFTINTFTWGQAASFAIYLAHYLQTNTFPKATSMDYAFIGGLQFALSLIFSPFITVVVRKCGTQVPMLIGIALQTAGFICASFASQIWHLYLSQGVLVGIGLNFIFVPCAPILSQWFDKKQSLATGISAAGAGVGGLLFSFGVQAMIEQISLPWTFRVTALICGVMNLVAVALIRNRNAAIKPPQIGFDTKLLARYDVLLLMGWGFLSMLCYVTLLYSLADFAHSIGLSNQQAAAISAYLNLGTACGRPIIGFTVVPISVEVVGLKEVPSVLSLMWVMIFLPILFAEVITLKLRRPSSASEYLYPQVFAGLSSVLASLCLLELWRVKRGQTLHRQDAQTTE